MRHLTWFLPLILISLVHTGPGAAQGGGPLDLPLPQLTGLKLEVGVDYETGRIDGTATLTVHNTSSASLPRVPLVLNRLMAVSGVRDGSGRDLAFGQRVVVYDDVPRFQVNAIQVDLAEPLLPGQSTRLAVGYDGQLVGYTEVGMRYTKDHVSRDFTILREDVLAFPVVGVPSMRASRAAPRGEFDYEVVATVPEDLVVATGGELVGRTVHAGLATWHYRSRDPAPFVAVAIAPYRIAEADGVRIFHFADDADGAAMVLEASRRAAARYGEIFGPLDRPMVLNVMQVPEDWGSQASLGGGILQEAGAFRDRTRLVEVYHELSHLWNARDLDAPSPRWNEGLAMFLQGRLARELDGWGGEAAALQRTAQQLVARCGPDRPCSRIPMRKYGNERMTDLSYSVGRLMFAALYYALGDAAFDRALRQHFQAHQSAGTRTDDLVRAFVDVGGSSARRIFDDWLESTAWVDHLREASSLDAVFDAYRLDIPRRRDGVVEFVTAGRGLLPT
jgi:hypothetical protein